ncbi:hypothetical protein CB0940_08752 [Cercospora beticola]|uniref:Ubiquitin carboxyl-terminal hydrolase 19 n=1 Tax=Cercospora beticola TaxID=122368 RepID=A0A2G5HP40_CERBT|nr:hypothetical protein CB0940_08752 [Cercospora beticola]PIA94327.1 hypothetical protein CB0940_08752 [Cercospora beticola]WPB05335.1 hypothetical protein RHO25_009987 [Cercospora beticola]CAK1365137.1 unnamed protein product [Cercospora beticola]
MDPQSQSFTPSFNINNNGNTTGIIGGSNGDHWRVQNDLLRVQQIQAEHAERIARLERKQDDDARMKSVWGNQSPFPSVLSGTPQHGPLQQPAADRFAGFDDEANNLMSSLHLDAEEEPRSRALGATSRANSVRFDESANQNHFSHSSRPSMDFFSRTGSGLGGLQMTERTSSHKSEGRASSVHSMRSAASGRASSLNLDTAAYGLDSARSPSEAPGLAPGLLLLGAVPAIIRCWMNTNFKHDALLYAAVCTGSYKSFLDLRLIQKLGFEDVIVAHEEGYRTVELPIYFPEAVPHPASSRSSSPAPQLPSLRVDFRVIEQVTQDDNDKSIQIFIGSDVLRAHNADILFSSNSMTLYDDERSKLSIPLSRPENEAAFNSLHVLSGSLPGAGVNASKARVVTPERPPYLNGLGRGSSTASVSSAAASPPPGKYRPPGIVAAETGATDLTKSGTTGSDSDSRPGLPARPSLAMLNTKTDREDPSSDSGGTSTTTGKSTVATPAIWSSWRRDGSTSASAAPSSSAGGSLDWANAGKNRELVYQRKDTGIKVLKPKTASRTVSAANAPIPSSSSGTASPAPVTESSKSRFFDEGRRISTAIGNERLTRENTKENSGALATPTTPGGSTVKTKANPIGGASAFSWLGK